MKFHTHIHMYIITSYYLSHHWFTLIVHLLLGKFWMNI